MSAVGLHDTNIGVSFFFRLQSFAPIYPCCLLGRQSKPHARGIDTFGIRFRLQSLLEDSGEPVKHLVVKSVNVSLTMAPLSMDMWVPLVGEYNHSP